MKTLPTRGAGCARRACFDTALRERRSLPPVYRLEWQSLGSLARRIRNCMTGVRAQPYEHGGIEMVELELHLMERARGMPLETPAVRP